MAKTYILEPTEAEFTASQDMFRANVNFDWTTLDGYPGDEAEDEEIDTFLANTFSGSTLIGGQKKSTRRRKWEEKKTPHLKKSNIN